MNSSKTTELLSKMIQHYPNGIIVLNQSRKIVLINTAARKLFSSAGVRLAAGAKFPYPIDPGFTAEISMTKEINGSSVVLEMTATSILHGEAPFMIIAVNDNTDRSLLREQLKTEALKDDLTQLYNRKGFITLSEHQLLLARREQRSLSVIFLDLDGLKTINDTYGHSEGDRVLADFASLLSQSFRHSDILARMGGDEFAVMVFGNQASAGDSALTRLAKNIYQFNSQQARQYALAVSYGSARFNHFAPVTLAQLMQLADANMYSNKRARKLANWAASCAYVGQGRKAG